MRKPGGPQGPHAGFHRFPSPPSEGNIESDGTTVKNVAGDITALVPSDDAALENIAREIEQLHVKAGLKTGERLATAQKIFHYRRDQGGFTGWIESRLKIISVATAYRLIDAYKRFGGGECFSSWETLPVSALYLLAAPSTPESAVDEITNRMNDGEKPTVAEVSKTIKRAKQKQNGNTDPGAAPPTSNSEESVEQRKAYYAAAESDDGRPATEQLGDGAPQDDGADDHAERERERDEGAEDDRFFDSLLADYFQQATPADIFERIPAHRRNDVLAAFPIEHVIEVFGEQLRAKLPANPLFKLRQMDDVSAASTIYEAFGARRFEVIVQKAHELYAPKGKNGAKRKKSDKPVKKTMQMEPAGTDASSNPIFAQQPRGNRSRAQ
jgi:hypothetical protein